MIGAAVTLNGCCDAQRRAGLIVAVALQEADREARIGSAVATVALAARRLVILLGGELVVFPDGGRIRIGDHCFIGGGSRVWSATDVQIGHRVMISHGVNIHDTISHSLHAGRRHQQFLDMSVRCDARLGDIPHRPVVIEDDAWIGLNAVVLKGVRIGRGAVVAAGAIVTKDVAPYTIVAGPVAQVIGESFP